MNARESELYLFNEGTSAYAYKELGCHRAQSENPGRRRFSVWAPSARAISVVGTFNGWDLNSDPMERIGSTGVWETEVENALPGELYKYAILQEDGELCFRADPFATRAELRPGTASEIYEFPDYCWTDNAYLKERGQRNPFQSPISIYELHAGSWRNGTGFRTLAHELVDYVADMGFTHIELMPVAEHPLDMSWGYQVTGFFAITSRYGTPEDFMYFVDRCHSRGIGVLVDWVPAHFPRDMHALRRFDGTALYEHPDPRRSNQPQWGTLLFNFGRTEVVSFLVSNAIYLLNEYHLDGLRVDAVSCMLYHDYAKKPGEWIPNEYGGRENLEAIAFLRTLSKTVGRECPGALLIAEESTAFALVTMPPEHGGLGFHFKWNMGWMNDTLSYMSLDPIHRKWQHDKLTFSLCYAFSENYILPFSHDEVVHGKLSLIGRMPGDYWRQFAQLRLLYAYLFAHPGKKLMFMGDEIAQYIEWRYYEQLEWFLLEYPMHKCVQDTVRELNRIYASSPALYRLDCGWEGFEWVSVNDRNNSVLAFLRRDGEGRAILCAFNFTPVPHGEYQMFFNDEIILCELFNSDDARFGGTGEWNNPNPIRARVHLENERPFTLSLRLPPLGAVYFDVSEGGSRI